MRKEECVENIGKYLSFFIKESNIKSAYFSRHTYDFTRHTYDFTLCIRMYILTLAILILLFQVLLYLCYKILRMI